MIIPRQGELRYVFTLVVVSIMLSVRVCVCPTVIGGSLCPPLLPFYVGRLTRDLGQMTANTLPMCLLGVT